MWSDFFFSCVFSCVCAPRTNARFWHIKSKFFWEMNLSFVMNLCTWKRIGAQKKDLIRIFVLMCFFMRLCAAQKRTVACTFSNLFNLELFLYLYLLCSLFHYFCSIISVIILHFFIPSLLILHSEPLTFSCK